MKVDPDYRGLAALVAERLCARERLRARVPRAGVIGIGGGQGAGKSTLARSLAAALVAAEPDRRGAVLSLDDFYLGRAERLRLARTVHPLLATRGVPGTHDVDRLLASLDRLFAARRTAVPVFDKGRDDRVGERVIEGPVDWVVLEGWCLGARPVPAAELVEPVNDLERQEDPDGTWRRFVNEALAGPYARLADRLDFFVFLLVPDMATVLRFRAQQEAGVEAARRMDPARLARFVAHYERITLALARDAPGRADLVVRLHADRSYSVHPPPANVTP